MGRGDIFVPCPQWWGFRFPLSLYKKVKVRPAWTLTNEVGMSLYERILWLPHNAIAHPLMVVLPYAWGVWIHNKTIPMSSSLKEKLLE